MIFLRVCFAMYTLLFIIMYINSNCEKNPAKASGTGVRSTCFKAIKTAVWEKL